MKAKDIAETAIRESGMEYAILRPSWIYGPGDHSMNRFIWFCRHLPLIPVIGDGQTPVYPAYVKDVARAVTELVRREDARDKVLEIGGPQRLTMDDVIRTVQEVLGRRRPLLHHPARPDEAARAPDGAPAQARCSRRARSTSSPRPSRSTRARPPSTWASRSGPCAPGSTNTWPEASLVAMADCERCRGTGFEITSVPGPDGKDVEVARRCTCQAADPASAADRRLAVPAHPSALRALHVRDLRDRRGEHAPRRKDARTW